MTNLEIPNINNQKPTPKLEDLSEQELAQLRDMRKEYAGILDEENKQTAELTANLKEKLNKIKESK